MGLLIFGPLLPHGFHFLLQDLRHRLVDLDCGEPAVHRLHQVPGRMAGICPGKHFLVHSLIFFEIFVPLPVAFGHPPGSLPGIKQFIKSLFLLFLINGQEEFDQHHPVRRQLFLKRQDGLVCLLHFLVADLLVKPVDQHLPVPAAVVDGDPSSGGHLHPEPPQERMHLLLPGLLLHRVNFKSSGIQRLDQLSDLQALPRRVVSLEGDHHRDPQFLAGPLQLPELWRQLLHPLLVLLFIQLLCQIQFFQHMPLSFLRLFPVKYAYIITYQAEAMQKYKRKGPGILRLPILLFLFLLLTSVLP